MQQLRRLGAAFALGVSGAAAWGAAALAQVPANWQVGFQTPFSPVMRDIENLHMVVLWIITAITVFVGGLLVWVLHRYNATRNPTPSRTSHNTVLEVAWTVVPVLVLVVIAIPSFRLVYFQDRVPANEPAMTVKVTGHQWNWEYSYPDNGNIDFTSYVVPDDQLKPGQLRLLEVDQPLVVPAGKNIRILTTSTDVIHSFYIPSLGVQRYAIPGVVIETWVRIDKPGTYHGQCNQICGENHSRMPIVVQAMTEADFNAWAQQKGKAGASLAPASPARTELADNRR